jgi:hypothetical protein
MNPGFMSNFEGRGRPITVERQSKPDVEVPLIPAERSVLR